MPCLLALFALLAPRITIILIVIFSDYIGRAYQTTLWPLLGFLFMPLTTLAYAHGINSGGIDGWRLILVVIAVLIDLGVVGGGAASRKKSVRPSGD